MKERIHSIDFLRGLVMVIMALDHTRDLFHLRALDQDPLNLETTTPALFATRWITHLCAPTFVFLSGLSAWLSAGRSTDAAAARRFLFTRGVWLMVLEYTVVNFGIWFDPQWRIVLSQVIAAIGFGFVALSVLSRLSARTVGILGLCIILGHGLLAGVDFPSSHPLHVPWGVLFRLSFFQVTPNFIFFVNYPWVPWLGLMLAGWGFGQVFESSPHRKRLLVGLGLGAWLLFVLLRTFNLYGNPTPWGPQQTVLFSFLSFINVSKYPPSLLFCCATLGSAFLLWALVEGKEHRLIRLLAVYGKVPLFYYLLHWYILHGGMVLLLLAQGFEWAALDFSPFRFGRPAGESGLGLAGVYGVWMAVVVALWPLCRWFGQYKAKHPEKTWLRYF